MTIATFIQYAKDAGIDIKCERQPFAQTKQTRQTAQKQPDTQPKLPTITPKITDKLPSLLKSIVEIGDSAADSDMLLLGTITVLSAIFPNMHGIYDQRVVYPNLFLFVTAPASSGKGRLSFCKKVIEPIHKLKREQAAAEKQEYEKKKSNNKDADIEAPKQRTLIIPANTSCTGFYQLLNDNDGQGIIFETEGDTLTKTFKTDYGDYSDGFRKGFHHESISYNRRKNNEFVEVTQPKFSVLLSGTPRQIKTLIEDTENGLFSRFMFYYLKTPLHWHDVFSNANDIPLDIIFDDIGQRVLKHYQHWQEWGDVLFELTESQIERFNKFFSAQQDSFIDSYGDGMLGSIRRLGLVAFRISMILSVLRTMDTGEVTNHLVCSDTDFDCSIEIVKCLMAHTAFIYSTYYQQESMKENSFKKQRLFETLPQEFTSKEFYEIATSLGIKKRTADGYIQKWTKKGYLTRMEQGVYFKNATTGYV